MNLSLPLFDTVDLPLPKLVPVPVPVPGHKPGPAAPGPVLAPAQVGNPVLGPILGPVTDPVADPVTDPALLHPSLWRASQVGGGRLRCTASGFAALDAQLPGGGWPHGELTELLQARPGIGELRLLAPALRTIAPRCVMLFDPPARLSAWGLAQQGLDSRHWLVLAPPLADLLWALEQALRSGQAGAVLAWLPQRLRADALRRLQLAAQAHDGPVFLLRHASLHRHASAAPLRLLLQPQGVDGLALRLLKRRGPPLAESLQLALPSPLTPGQQARALARLALGQAMQVPARPWA